jgi:single-strand DNA-binding protein
MPSLNKVHLIGNITRDIDLKYTPKGTAIADIGLAINRTWKEEGQSREETTFVDITFWGRTAETVSKYAKKGDPLFVEGRLQLDAWDDKQTGQKRSKLKVTGESIQLLGGKSTEKATVHAPAHASAAAPARRPEASRPVAPPDPRSGQEDGLEYLD